MAIFSSRFYGSDGRVAGSYVYMLLCPEDDRIHIKIGMSSDPTKRLLNLITASPVAPKTLALVKVSSREIARGLESSLHFALAKWRANGEWFKFLPEDKPAFNAIQQSVLRSYSSPSARLSWMKIDPKAAASATRAVSR